MATIVLNLPDETEIQRQVSDAVFQRGESYCTRGAVMSLVRRGDALVAEVAGGAIEPYRVTVAPERGGVRARCTCPYMDGWDGWCKHVVAVLLCALRDPAAIGDEPELSTLLAPLTAEQLRSLVAEWAGADPDGYERVRTFAARCKEPQGGRESVDAARSMARRRIRRVLRSLEGLPASEAQARAGEAAQQVLAVMDEVVGCLERGECAVALAQLEGATSEYVSAWAEAGEADAPGVDPSRAFWTLGRVWAEAILTAPLTDEGRRTLEKRLARWSGELERYGIESLELAVAAAREGWSAPRVAAALAGRPVPPRRESPDDKESADGESDPAEYGLPDRSAELTEVRLRVLERAGRMEDALRLARAEGLHGRAADLLIALGRMDEALALAMEHLPSRAEALALARRLWDGGDPARALELGERALEIGGPHHEAGLAAWVRDRAAESGRPALALRAAEDAFRADPGVPAWRALEEAAGAGWPAVRERMLAWLRDLPAGAHRHGAVEVFLHEALPADALDAVEGSADYRLLARVAAAAVDAFPARVLPLCLAQAEEIMDAGHSAAYEAAAAWLRRARRAYAALGRAREWNRYRAALLARHQKKYRLRPLLAALGELP